MNITLLHYYNYWSVEGYCGWYLRIHGTKEIGIGRLVNREWWLGCHIPWCLSKCCSCVGQLASSYSGGRRLRTRQIQEIAAQLSLGINKSNPWLFYTARTQNNNAIMSTLNNRINAWPLWFLFRFRNQSTLFLFNIPNHFGLQHT